ncbi:aldehyde dehydrogenase family protein [Yoonia sp. I 8.24]|uniref:aldehyde dehydrogenase family protein n=1 Tax=Yoonia sp. I 8.24 TaxID=1537229 RepID=UPI001EE045C4|nr:aldehyde dehydrogenase family protein [Yoonia sp. I 8.24]MCG3267690.1 aldehyde dehydrogenase family protein [Yoonia sp. I 8.24]
MLTLNKFYIDGAWVDPASDATMPIMNPATEAQIGTVSMGSSEDVDRAVAAAKRAFETFSMTTKDERLALLKKLRVATEARLGDLAKAMTAEMGAPATMSLGVQADAGLGHLDHFITALETLNEEEILYNSDIISHEPIGVCGLITPWNWPINQIALKVVPALATGATCVLKPSEHTPMSAQIYAEIVDAAGYPAGVFNLVQGDGMSVGSAMSRHPDIDMMSFTGSTRAGTAVSKDAADTVKRVTLELGGKSPNLVFADADLDKRIKESVAGCFYNTGQSCNAPTRLLVERSCYDEVLEIAKSVALAQEVGDPTQEGDHIGPLFDKIQYDRVQAMIQMGIDEGARVLVGGLGRPDGIEKGWFVKPTIFCDVDHDMRISREEIFGPVLVITAFDTEQDAIRMANDTEYGLAAYVQTSDPERAARVVRQLRAGTIQINGRGPDYGSPFGGYKQSGNGREGGMLGLEDYLEVKVRPPFVA